MVEKRWRAACEKENRSTSAVDGAMQSVVSNVPTDSEVAASFIDRKKRLFFVIELYIFFPKQHKQFSVLLRVMHYLFNL